MSLIEIMVVLAIIALVMGLLVGPAIFKHFREAQVRSTRLMTKQIASALTRWRLSSSRECPDSIDALKEDLGREAGEHIVDAWGQPYVLKCGDDAPEACTSRTCALSLGADGKDGTDDDIASWQDVRGR